jgi:hypothetical protein
MWSTVENEINRPTGGLRAKPVPHGFAPSRLIPLWEGSEPLSPLSLSGNAPKH